MIIEHPSGTSEMECGCSREKNLVPTCPWIIALERQVFLVGGRFRVGEVVGMLLKDGGVPVCGGGGGIVEGTVILCTCFTLEEDAFPEDIVFLNLKIKKK